MTFSERLTLRHRLWWELSLDAGLVHRLRDIRTERRADDPDSVWRCCEFWQRTVINKWNGREFAARHGARPPALYWKGGPLARMPLERLPDGFAVRSVRGYGQRRVLVVSGSRELLHGKTSPRSDLSRRRRMRLAMPVLVEELVQTPGREGRLPIEYKCHAFDAIVLAVEWVERTGPLAGWRRFYTPDWKPFPDVMHTALPQADVQDPPPWLGEMVSQASRLGAALGTYMRIDFFAGIDGPVFNEFSSMPLGAHGYTPYADEVLGSYWADLLPDAS